MVWQRMIQVLGGVAIFIGVLSMCSSLSSIAGGLIGPEPLLAEAEDESMPAMMRDSSLASARALEHGVFRTFRVVHGGLNSAMAVLLIAAGIGLVRLRLWGRRLALIWSVYAVVGAVVMAVMIGRYLLPEMVAVSSQPMPAGTEVMASVLLLLVLWVFPVALFTLLKLPVVVRMMAAAERSPRPQAQPFDPPLPASPGPLPEAIDGAPPTPPPAAAPPPAHQTWRDDPWNDPSAT